MKQSLFKSITIGITSIFLLSLLSACAPTRYPPGKHHQSSKAQPSSSQGKVKRGNPYQIAGQWYYPLASGENYDETGMASWYGEDFHGKNTANGEIYDMYEMTAAHTTLPMPSIVLVTNLENGKRIQVRLNDRGPFVKNRLIDLSYAAAKALGYTEKGTTRVRVQTLDVPPAASSSSPAIQRYAPSPIATQQAYIQVGAFSVKASAKNIANRLSYDLKGQFQAHVVPAGGVYRVRLGPFATDDAAMSALQQVKQQGYASAMIIHD